MRIAYVAGPYRAQTPNGILENIWMARRASVALWRLGIPALCPHLNSMLMDGVAPDKVFLEGDHEFLRRLGVGDVLVLLPDWRLSSGSLGEIPIATERGMEIVEYDPQTDLLHSHDGVWGGDEAQDEKARLTQRWGRPPNRHRCPVWRPGTGVRPVGRWPRTDAPGANTGH